MEEIDWAALLEGKEPTREITVETSGISGLQSVGSEISLSGSTPSKDREKLRNTSESGSLINLQSVNDLLAPSPEPFRCRSAASIKSNVTFSESEPEVFNIAEEINLMSIGDLSGGGDDSQQIADDYSDEEFEKTSSAVRNSEKYTETQSVGNLKSVYSEEHYSEEDDQISEEIKTKSDGWKSVKDKLLNKGNKIPVFMVGPKKKKLSRDLSFTKSGDKTDLSQMFSRKSSRSSIKSEVSSKRSSVISEKSYNYTSANSATEDTSTAEDLTTVSRSSETKSVAKSRRMPKMEQPCCRCRCQTADLNMKAVPLSGLVLNSKTLDEISQMNPDKVALLNIMKAQYNLTRGLLDITSHIITSEIESCQPTARYTDIEETKRYIRENQPFKREKRRKHRDKA